jgi:hypothetical protein
MFEKLTKLKKLDRAKKLHQSARAADYKWQGAAVDDFKFRDGEQWTSDEKHIMEEELRPVLTFNLTKSSIDLIMGMNEDNRKVFRASPIDPTDGFLCEVLNDIAGWTQETNAFEDEEDAALESAAICGRGFVGIDFGPDPKRFGEIEMSELEISVHEIHFDPAARRTNLEDASYICWDRWISLQEFKMRYPEVKGKKLDEIVQSARNWTVGDSSGMLEQPSFDMPSDLSSDDSDYDRELDMEFYDKGNEMIKIVHMEYWETFIRYYIWNPVAGVFEESPDGKPTKEVMAMFAAEFGQEMVIETMMDKKVKWLQFTGDMILYDDDSPMPHAGFSIVPMFAFADVSKRTMNHFGLVRLIKDPQREVNKRWSQALNMLNNQVAPGIFAETDAFVDEEQAKQSMKTAGEITWTNSGAIQGGKIQERNVPTFPNAPMQMEQFSQDIMKKITGINPDLLGQDRGRQEPGVVIRLRQQQGVTLLKPLFRNFNRMKKDLFKRQLSIIMAYMPDEQILRILGQNDRYQITPEGIIIDTASMNDQGQPTLIANIRDVRELEYNVAAEEAPGNMAKRMLELQALMEMMQAGFPVDPNQVIEKMEIAESEKKRWLDYITATQNEQAQQAENEAEFAKQLEIRKLELQEQDMQMDFMVDIAKINQMAEKDEKKMQQVFMQLGEQEKQNMAQFISNMLNVMTDVAAQESEAEKMQQELEQSRQEHTMNITAKAAEAKIGLDAKQSDADISEKSKKSDLELTKAKNKETLEFTKKKNALALALQKRKGEQKDDGTTRSTSTKK